jgi:hypothetical protein
MFHTSKYAYKAKPRHCLKLSIGKVVIPTGLISETIAPFTEIAFAWICADHKSYLDIAKNQAILAADEMVKKHAEIEQLYNEAKAKADNLKKIVPAKM